MDDQEYLPEALLPWFDAHKRDLPWRQDKAPYHIWLSEIMLQQTRVEAVRGYYDRFLQALPTVEALANCPDDQLHKLWEGLGYYSRVRNLKKAAKEIMSTYSGEFPWEYEKILALPGIGAYTAGAICSIAFDQKTPAVDGNVLRVYARLTNDSTPIDRPDFRKRVQADLQRIYPDRAGDFTQALMELGATVCGPNRLPQCEICPCREFCRGYAAGTAQDLPVKGEKRPKRREQYTLFVLEHQGQFALCRRQDRGLLASLWEFPNLPGRLELPQGIGQIEQWGMTVADVHRKLERNHIFTHVVWEMRCYYMTVREKSDRFIWFTPAQIRETAALPTAFRQFWEARE